MFIAKLKIVSMVTVSGVVGLGGVFAASGSHSASEFHATTQRVAQERVAQTSAPEAQPEAQPAKEEGRVVTGFVFEGNTQIQAQDLEKVLETKRGSVLNRDTINTDVERIQKLYRDKGFSALVSEVRQLDNGNILFRLREAKISRIDLNGLKRIPEAQVRRQIQTKTGDVFETGKLRADLNRIFNMGFFEDVTYKLADTPEPSDSIIVTITVSEKPAAGADGM